VTFIESSVEISIICSYSDIFLIAKLIFSAALRCHVAFFGILVVSINPTNCLGVEVCFGVELYTLPLVAGDLTLNYRVLLICNMYMRCKTLDIYFE
ncbi:14090_t:CDS:2, partial [Rhizophagus irregularis]